MQMRYFQTDDKAVSVSAVKKILDSEYGKKNNNLINSELISLARKGLIVNTSGTKSASGSYVINPEFENFDTRRSFISKPLGSIERVIENVITRFCYDGAPCVDEVHYIFLVYIKYYRDNQVYFVVSKEPYETCGVVSCDARTTPYLDSFKRLLSLLPLSTYLPMFTYLPVSTILPT